MVGGKWKQNGSAEITRLSRKTIYWPFNVFRMIIYFLLPTSW